MENRSIQPNDPTATDDRLVADSVVPQTFADPLDGPTDQQDIAYLNGDDGAEQEISEAVVSSVTDENALDESIQSWLAAFEAESVEKLAFLNLVSGTDATRAILEDLFSGIPVKTHYQPTGLTDPLVLLIKPDLSPQNQVQLQVVPYLKTND